MPQMTSAPRGSVPARSASSRARRKNAGRFAVFGVYCRNDQALSQATATTPATGPEDPRVSRLLQQLFLVLFNDSPAVRRSRFPIFKRF